jgi:hypothetical protein
LGQEANKKRYPKRKRNNMNKYQWQTVAKVEKHRQTMQHIGEALAVAGMAVLAIAYFMIVNLK